MTWKLCTPRCTPAFGRTHRLFQKPTRTKAKSPNSKTRRRSPQRKGGITFSTRSSPDAKKQNPRSKETQLSTRFPTFFFSLPRVKVFTSSFSVEYPRLLHFLLRLLRLPPQRIHRFICP